MSSAKRGRVLLTGGAGFVGSHTADALLAAGYDVRILDSLIAQVHGPQRAVPAYLDSRVDFVRGDVCNSKDVHAALEGVDVVFHCAALTGVGQSMYEVESYVHTNCTGTATLLDAIVKRRQPIKRLILSSSRAVYGEGTYVCVTHGVVHPVGRRQEDMRAGKFAMFCPHCQAELRPMATPEQRPLHTQSLYALTKKQQEELCQYAAATFGLPVTILRYFNVYGSRQSLLNPYTGVASIFYSRLMAGKPIFLYEQGAPLRDFVHIRDVVQANLLAIEAQAEPGACFNVGTGTPMTIADLARGLASACERSAELVPNNEYRLGDIWACYADLRESARVLGYSPHVDLATGLSELLQWARAEESVDLYDQSVRELAAHGLFARAADAA